MADHTELAAPRQDGPQLAASGQDGIVRVEAVEKVTGRARYSTDVVLPGTLVGAVLRSPHPHARVRSVDTDRAAALAGVHAVITAADVGDLRWYDEDTPFFGDVVRFVGDEVAAVAAESIEVARDALDLIAVDYEMLPHVVGAEAALADDAPVIHADGGDGNLVEEPDGAERGDVDAALATADVVVEATFTTPVAVHNALEPHGATARWDGRQLTVWTSTQAIFDVRDALAQRLGLGQHQVRVVTEHMGGGFGAKQVPFKSTAIAALLAVRTGRPVRLHNDREGENLAAGKRNSSHQRVSIGARSDGTLVAIDADIVIDAGAYSVPGEAAAVTGPFQYLYRCENVRTRKRMAYTNTGPIVAFRAPGYVESTFVLESAMDELAERLDLDPVELRRRNHTDRDQVADLPLSSPDSLLRCIDRATAVFGWQEVFGRPGAGTDGDGGGDGRVRRGVGFAAHEWLQGKGQPPGYADVEINPDGTVRVSTGTQDIGTGTRTALAQIATEELGAAVDDVSVTLGDTAGGPYAPVSSGSSTVPTMGPAVQAAAADARARLLDAAAGLLETDASALHIADGAISNASGDVSIDVAEVAGEVGPQRIRGHGERLANPDDVSIRTFGAACAEVEVDLDTGEVTVVRVVSAPGCGRIVNPRLARSQVLGGVTQGIGYALTESQLIDAGLGLVVNPNLEDYLVPTVADTGDIVHAVVDEADTAANPTGAKGIGELPLIPVAPAIANAVHAAVGIRFRDLPITPARVITALESAALEERA